MTNKDYQILRELAYSYAEISLDPHNEETIKLYKAINSLRPIRPVALIDEIPWSEFEDHDELKLTCEDNDARGFESIFRRTLFKWNHMRADMALWPYFCINKSFSGGGFGISVDEKRLATDDRNGIVSHEYHDVMSTEDDIERITMPKLTVNHESNNERLELGNKIFKDLLPVKLCGTGTYCSPWDSIAMWRGVTNLLEDLVLRPEFTHKLMQKLTDWYNSLLTQYEELDLLEPNLMTIHCTPAPCDDLPKSTDGKTRASDIWGRGMAQIFASVSPDMHKEFDLDYMKPFLERCGLSYYGCCEPLDRKIDILRATIKNLRKVSVTPWANFDVCAEKIHGDFVMSYKPNPAFVATASFDPAPVEAEINHALSAAKKHSCACEFIIKDISSCSYKPENLFNWEKTVMNLIKA